MVGKWFGLGGSSKGTPRIKGSLPHSGVKGAKAGNTSKGTTRTSSTSGNIPITVSHYDIQNTDVRVVNVSGQLRSQYQEDLERMLSHELGLKRVVGAAIGGAYTPSSRNLGYRRLILDLSGVTSINSGPAASIIHFAEQRFRENVENGIAERTSKLIRPEDMDARAIFYLLGLHRRYEIYGSLDRAKIAFDLDRVINSARMIVERSGEERRTGSAERRSEEIEIDFADRRGDILNRRTGTDRRNVSGGIPFEDPDAEIKRWRYVREDPKYQVREQGIDQLFEGRDNEFLYAQEGQTPLVKQLYLGITDPEQKTCLKTLTDLAVTYLIDNPNMHRLYRKVRILLQWKAYDSRDTVRNYARLLLWLTNPGEMKGDDAQQAEEDIRVLPIRKKGIDYTATKLFPKSPNLARTLLRWKEQHDTSEEIKDYAAQKLAEIGSTSR